MKIMPVQILSYTRRLIAAILLLFLSPALAIAMPQRDDGAVLFHAAPEECWLFSSWSNQGRPDANSANQTDQLMAEPEVKKFVDDLIDRAGRIMPMAFMNDENGRREIAEKVSPAIVNAMFGKSGCLFVERVDFGDFNAPPRIEAVVLIEVGNEAQQVVDGFAKLLSSPDTPAKTIKIEGQDFNSFELDPNVEVCIGRQGTHLLIGVGKTAVGNTLKRMAAGKSPQWLLDLQQRHSLERRTSLGYINADLIRETFLPLGGPEAKEIVSALGLDNVRSLESSAGYSETGMVNRILLRVDGRPRGILALAGNNGIETSDLTHVPDDSMFTIALSLDGEKIVSYIQSLLTRFSPEEAMNMAQFMVEFQARTGVDPQNEILAQLGPTWTLYNGASDGWLAGVTLTATAKDPQRLSDALEQLVESIRELSDGDRYAPTFRQQTMGDTQITSVIIPGIPMPVEPSWSIVGDRLVVTLFPQAIAPIAKPMKYESLFETGNIDGYRAAFSAKGEPGKLLGLFHSDTQLQFEMTYPYLQVLAAMGRSAIADSRQMPPELAEAISSLVDGIELPPARSIHRHLLPTISMVRQTSAGFEFETHQTLPMVDVTFTVPLGVGLLLPAVQSARSAARRVQSMNNLKQIGLALHNYHDVFNSFPPANSVDDNGKPLLSWRVHILPYIEEYALYEQFHLDEPWDSEHNLELLQQMPLSFRSPVSNAPPGMTTYLGIEGDDGTFPTAEKKNKKGRRFAEILDGTSNTVMVVETSDALAVEWTKPDSNLGPNGLDLGTLFGAFPGGTNALFADGSVQFISDAIDWNVFKQLMNIKDGLPGWDWESKLERE